MDPGEISRIGANGSVFVALAPGTTVGRYEILDTLGHGSFGITYRARDTRLGREIAIKEYLPSMLAVRQEGASVVPRSTNVAGDFTWGRDRFVAEGQTLATLDKVPGIVRVFDFLEANGTAYIVMPLLAGESLDSRLKNQKRLPPDEIENILWPLLDGLEQVHKVGFLHRDIKPANILLDAEGRPVLIDFGAARVAVADGTSAMTAVFTPGYAAAEQFTSARQGPWTDIYGLSATLYHAVIGHPPPSAFDRMYDDGYEALTKLAPQGFAASILAGIDAGLGLRADDRPQSIAAWRAIFGRSPLEAGLAETVVLDKRPFPPPKAAPDATVVTGSLPMPAKSVKPKTTLWIGGVLAGIAVVGGGLYLTTLMKSQDGSPPAAAALQQTGENREKAEAEAQRKAETEQKIQAQQRADAERMGQERKAEADRALRNQIVEEARRQLDIERAVEQKRIADEAGRKAEAEAAARRLADEEARRKAEEQAELARRHEVEDKKAAEAAETALQLSSLDRQHIQAALGGLGFNTGAVDGVMGPRSREMIVNWQKSRNYGATGFLTGAQNQALLKEASAAVAKFDDEQKKSERAKAGEAKGSVERNVIQQPAGVAAFDGTWSAAMNCPTEGTSKGYTWRFTIAITNGSIKGVYGVPPRAPWAAFDGQVQANGSATLSAHGVSGASEYNIGNAPAGSRVEFPLDARFEGARGTGTRTQGRHCTLTFAKL